MLARAWFGVVAASLWYFNERLLGLGEPIVVGFVMLSLWVGFVALEEKCVFLSERNAELLEEVGSLREQIESLANDVEAISQNIARDEDLPLIEEES